MAASHVRLDSPKRNRGGRGDAKSQKDTRTPRGAIDFSECTPTLILGPAIRVWGNPELRIPGFAGKPAEFRGQNLETV